MGLCSGDQRRCCWRSGGTAVGVGAVLLVGGGGGLHYTAGRLLLHSLLGPHGDWSVILLLYSQ